MPTEVSFSLRSIDIINRLLTAPSSANEVEFTFQIELDVIPYAESKTCAHIFKIRILSKDEENILAALTVGCLYNIMNFDDIIIDNELGLSFPPEFNHLLNTVTIGTARGILFSELKGTYLDKAFLPILDPRKFQPKSEKAES
jgi:hypothetical protein